MAEEAKTEETAFILPTIKHKKRIMNNKRIVRALAKAQTMMKKKRLIFVN